VSVDFLLTEYGPERPVERFPQTLILRLPLERPVERESENQRLRELQLSRVADT
jgi:hypothetical protein